MELASDVEGLRLVLETTMGERYRVVVRDDGAVAAQDEGAAADVTGFTGTVGKGIGIPGVETTEVLLPNGFSEWTGAWRRVGVERPAPHGRRRSHRQLDPRP